MTFTLTIAGSAESFNASTLQIELAALLAVPAHAVELTVYAASVVVGTLVSAPTAAEAERTHRLVLSWNASSLSALLPSYTVLDLSQPTLYAGGVPPPSPPPRLPVAPLPLGGSALVDSQADATAAVAAGIAGALLIVVGFVGWRTVRRLRHRLAFRRQGRVCEVHVGKDIRVDFPSELDDGVHNTDDNSAHSTERIDASACTTMSEGTPPPICGDSELMDDAEVAEEARRMAAQLWAFHELESPTTDPAKTISTPPVRALGQPSSHLGSASGHSVVSRIRRTRSLLEEELEGSKEGELPKLEGSGERVDCAPAVTPPPSVSDQVRAQVLAARHRAARRAAQTVAGGGLGSRGFDERPGMAWLQRREELLNDARACASATLEASTAVGQSAGTGSGDATGPLEGMPDWLRRRAEILARRSERSEALMDGATDDSVDGVHDRQPLPGMAWLTQHETAVCGSSPLSGGQRYRPSPRERGPLPQQRPLPSPTLDTPPDPVTRSLQIASIMGAGYTTPVSKPHAAAEGDVEAVSAAKRRTRERMERVRSARKKLPSGVLPRQLNYGTPQSSQQQWLDRAMAYGVEYTPNFPDRLSPRREEPVTSAQNWLIRSLGEVHSSEVESGELVAEGVGEGAGEAPGSLTP